MINRLSDTTVVNILPDHINVILKGNDVEKFDFLVKENPTLSRPGILRKLIQDEYERRIIVNKKPSE